MTIDDAVKQYMAHLEEAQSSRTHLATVRRRLGRFAAGREGIALNAVTQQMIDEHFDELRAAGLAVGTLAGYQSTQRAFWNWCVSEGLARANPSDVLRARRHAYSFEPVNSRAVPAADFVAAVRAVPDFVAARDYADRDVRDAALFWLAVDSAARRGELRNLRRKDVIRALRHGEQLPNGTTVFRARSVGKTGASTVRFFEDTSWLLSLWLDRMPDAAWVFVSLRTGKRLRADAMHLGLHRICEFAGVPPFRFHAIRKRVVTDAIEQSGDMKVGQLLAGHKDQRTTQTYYNDVQEDRVAEAAAALAAARRNKKGDGLTDAFFAKIP